MPTADSLCTKHQRCTSWLCFGNYHRLVSLKGSLVPFLETGSPVSPGNQSYHFPLTHKTHTHTTMEGVGREKMNHVHKDHFSLVHGHVCAHTHTHAVIWHRLSRLARHAEDRKWTSDTQSVWWSRNVTSLHCAGFFPWHELQDMNRGRGKHCPNYKEIVRKHSGVSAVTLRLSSLMRIFLVISGIFISLASRWCLCLFKAIPVDCSVEDVSPSCLVRQTNQMWPVSLRVLFFFIFKAKSFVMLAKL